jgi:hypothetical protein
MTSWIGACLIDRREHFVFFMLLLVSFKIEPGNSVRTSQETHYVSATEPNRLMLFGKTVAVYCENHTEHTQSVPHRKHITPPLQRPTG